MSLVRENLLTRPFYKPYCGNEGKCPGHWPRMSFKDGQFECSKCGYRTNFEAEFIKAYLVKAKELESSLSADERKQLWLQSLF